MCVHDRKELGRCTGGEGNHRQGPYEGYNSEEAVRFYGLGDARERRHKDNTSGCNSFIRKLSGEKRRYAGSKTVSHNENLLSGGPILDEPVPGGTRVASKTWLARRTSTVTETAVIDSEDVG